jgi:hypothetical protein
MNNIFNNSLLNRQSQSPYVGNLAMALSRAQGTMGLARKGAVNARYGSTYADLGTCIDMCRKHLSDNGLALIQTIQTDNHGNLHLFTRLIHGTSGEWIESDYPIVCPLENHHAVGSALTYARRYSLCALVGIAAEDDDANEAVKTYINKEVEENDVTQTRNGESTATATDKQITTMTQMAEERKVSLESIILETFKGSVLAIENLTRVQASKIITLLSQHSNTNVVQKAV